MIRLMRGQVVVRELAPSSAHLWIPDGNPRDRKTHTGVVLAVGPPARTPTGAEVKRGFIVNDVVQYHFTHHEGVATNLWEDGKPATWIPQQNVDGVWEEETDVLHA